MPILTLLGAMVFALAGAATLAFRVVRVPQSNAATRNPASSRSPRANAGQSTAALQKHMTDEFQRHTIGLREALNLRRARNEPEAQTRLLNERVRHAVAARDLARFIRPTSGGRLRKWMDQAWLDMYVDRVRREVAAIRVPNHTRPLAGEGALRRMITWIQGGPRAGYASDLVSYHRIQRAHYRMAMAQARKLARENRQDEAQTRLWNEQDFHMRVERELGQLTGPSPQPGPASPDTAPLTPVTP
jgi:hypothetical protein